MLKPLVTVVIVTLYVIPSWALGRAAAHPLQQVSQTAAAFYWCQDGFLAPMRMRGHANSWAPVSVDVVLGRTLAADKHRLGTGEAGPVHVSYTVRVLDALGRFQLPRKIRIEGVNSPLALTRSPPSPDYWIPNVPVGGYWVTLIQPTGQKGVYAYTYGVLPIGFIAPIVLNRGDLPVVESGLAAMRKYIPASGRGPISRSVAISLIHSRNYCRWAMGCAMLAMRGGGKDVESLVGLMEQMAWPNQRVRLRIRREAWLVMLLTKVVPPGRLTARQRAVIRAELLLFLYANSGVLAGERVGVPHAGIIGESEAFPGNSGMFHSRSSGFLDRPFDVLSLKSVLADTVPKSLIQRTRTHRTVARKPRFALLWAAGIGGVVLGAATAGLVCWLLRRARRSPGKG